MSLTPRTLEQLRDLAPGFVYGTLNADDLAAFEVGLRTPALAAELQKEITALQAAADAPLPNVPDALDEIRARINREAPPLTLDSKVRRATPNSRAVRVTPPSMPVVEPMDRRRAGKSPGRAGWYAAAVMTAGLAATLFVALDLRARVATLEGQDKEKSSLLARVEAKTSEKEKLLATLLAGRGNVVLVNLEASAPTGPGMQLFWNVRDGKAVVNAYGLAQVASNRAYMLWMIRDGTPVPLKLFTPDESGRAMVADIEAPTSMTGITLFTVTEESSAGAEAPSMTPFIAGTVPAATK
ncbi:anti-sigma factor [Gemmatimonas phototrophica]|uniref:Anti-sigma K factor RskA C-terminal domain-containing protein n=1 Tax=Gemmatimonas phototrophica TaxID=1379270 RepID=A0A143BL69_9BACT|nr:anti-sigma factor [Gemmatimonas phototrophica]AMW05748.1 hypothetical protein GEMMAAP_14965 [Gemmatimonas phototrophica]